MTVVVKAVTALTTTINICDRRSYSGNRADYDDKFLFSRSYIRNRRDYDDKKELKYI